MKPLLVYLSTDLRIYGNSTNKFHEIDKKKFVYNNQLSDCLNIN
jgi:hypothetical protein